MREDRDPLFGFDKLRVATCGHSTEEAAKLNDQATEVFERGPRDRQRSDEYVRITVTLATVLLLVAISQRFKTRGVRYGLLVIAVLLLCFPVYHILTLPRA